MRSLPHPSEQLLNGCLPARLDAVGRGFCILPVESRSDRELVGLSAVHGCEEAAGVNRLPFKATGQSEASRADSQVPDRRIPKACCVGRLDAILPALSQPLWVLAGLDSRCGRAESDADDGSCNYADRRRDYAGARGLEFALDAVEPESPRGPPIAESARFDARLHRSALG